MTLGSKQVALQNFSDLDSSKDIQNLITFADADLLDILEGFTIDDNFGEANRELELILCQQSLKFEIP